MAVTMPCWEKRIQLPSPQGGSLLYSSLPNGSPAYPLCEFGHLVDPLV